MQNFNQYESENYDFYRFTRLVIDTLIKDNNFCIPYDMELEIIYKAYLRFEYSEESTNPYQEQVDFVLTDKKLLLDLQASNEGY